MTVGFLAGKAEHPNDQAPILQQGVLSVHCDRLGGAKVVGDSLINR